MHLPIDTSSVEPDDFLDILSNPNNFVTQMVKIILTLDSSALRLIQYEIFCNSSERVGLPIQVFLGVEWQGHRVMVGDCVSFVFSDTQQWGARLSFQHC